MPVSFLDSEGARDLVLRSRELYTPKLQLLSFLYSIFRYPSVNGSNLIHRLIWLQDQRLGLKSISKQSLWQK